MEPITLSDMKRIDEYCERATNGPWSTIADGALINKIITPNCGFRSFDHHLPQNAEFIVQARTDLPRLSAALREMMAERDRLKEWVDVLRERLKVAKSVCREVSEWIESVPFDSEAILKQLSTITED